MVEAASARGRHLDFMPSVSSGGRSLAVPPTCWLCPASPQRRSCRRPRFHMGNQGREKSVPCPDGRPVLPWSRHQLRPVLVEKAKRKHMVLVTESGPFQNRKPLEPGSCFQEAGPAGQRQALGAHAVAVRPRCCEQGRLSGCPRSRSLFFPMHTPRGKGWADTCCLIQINNSSVSQ